MREMNGQKWEKMNRKQQWQYFVDYHLLHAVLVAAGIAVAVFLFWHFLQPAQEWALYVGFVDEELNVQEADELQKQLEDIFAAKGNDCPVILDDKFYLNQDGLSKMQVYLSNHRLDVIVADKDTFEMLAGYGFFQDLEDTGLGKYQEKLQYMPGYKETDEISLEDNETGQGEVEAYGISLTGSQVYTKIGTVIKEPVAGIVQEAPNQSEAAEFIELLLR